MTLANHHIKHFGLHHLDNVEVRIVADVVSGILRVEQAELDVVERLASDPRWQHSVVTLFVLADLQPLARQLAALGKEPADARLRQSDELLSRLVVNVYDLASPAACNVFLNRQAMAKTGYWEDDLALRGLLAHEHAHPLAECPMAAHLRAVQLRLGVDMVDGWAPEPAQAAQWAQRGAQQALVLTTKLLLAGPREVFTNQIAVEAGFGPALVYLNRQNVANLATGLVYRPLLHDQLAVLVQERQISQAGADVIELIGDLQAFLPLAMESAPFERAGVGEQATAFLHRLTAELLPQLAPQAAPLFAALAAAYCELDVAADASTAQAFVGGGLAAFATALHAFGASLAYVID